MNELQGIVSANGRKYLRCTKKVRNLYRMPKTNAETPVTDKQLRDYADRIETLAVEFRKAADLLTDLKLVSMPLAIDSFLTSTLVRVESFKRSPGGYR